MKQDAALASSWAGRSKRSKYGNRKVTKVSRDGKSETFDSVREYERHLVLLDMQKRGEIASLSRQPRYDLFVRNKLICTYVADWQYRQLDDNGSYSINVAEDAKGFQTPEFKLKWKLAKALYPEIDWRLS